METLTELYATVTTNKSYGISLVFYDTPEEGLVSLERYNELKKQRIVNKLREI